MSPRILIVDDDPAQRRLLEILVHRFGYAAETAAGGALALDRIAAPLEPPVDLMLLDLVMPGIDGMAVLQRMRGAAFRHARDRRRRHKAPLRSRRCARGRLIS